MKKLSGILVVIASLALSIPAYAVGRGDSGDAVKEVQTILSEFGYTVAVDGQFGPQTEKAVRSWQKSNGLYVDGIAGPITTASLRRAVRGQAVQVTPVAPSVPEHYDQWVALAVCESGSRWDYNGSSGYDGGLQFSPRTWTGFNGDEFAQYAWQASALEQMIVAERVLDVQGWKAWPTCSRKLGYR